MNDELTMTEAAERLGISRTTLGRLVREGVLPVRHNPLDKRERLIPEEAILRLVGTGRPRFVSDGAGDNAGGPNASEVKEWIRARWPRSC